MNSIMKYLFLLAFGTLSLCSHHGEYTYRYLGCYHDKGIIKPRALPYRKYPTRTGLTIQLCMNLCAGYWYFGVQSGNECYCGNRGYDIYGNTSGCTVRCSGNRTQMCGGHWKSSVYQIVEKTTTHTTTPASTTTAPATTTTTPATTTTALAATTTTPASTTTTPASSTTTPASSTTTPASTTTLTTTTTTFAITTSMIIFSSKTSNSTTPAATPFPTKIGVSTHPVSTNNSHPGSSKQPQKSVGIYAGSAVAAVTVCVIVTIIVIVVLRRRRKPSAMVAQPHSNPTYEPNIQEETTPAQQATIDEVEYSYVTLDSVGQPISDEARLEDGATNGGKGAGGQSSTCITQCEVVNDSGGDEDNVYSLAEPIEDDLVIAENDLYGT